MAPLVRERASIALNAVLQVAGDPRWWPRDLPIKRDKLLWRPVIRADASAWPPADRTARLRGLADAQFQEAKLWYLGVTYLYAAAAILAVVAYFANESGQRQQLATIGAVTAQILAVLARMRAIRLHEIAHKADWRALIMDGIGPSRKEEDHAMILETIISDRARSRAGELPHYFTGSLPQGPLRFIANLRETTFYTAALYKTAAVRAVFLAAVVLLVPLAGPIYSIVTGDAISGAIAVVAVSSVLPLWDVFGRVRTWRASGDTLERATETLADVTDLRDALPVFSDAVIATATAPPIPRRIYDAKQAELQEQWRAVSHEWPALGPDKPPVRYVADAAGRRDDDDTVAPVKA